MMPDTQDPQVTELFRLILNLYARQMATLQLLEKAGVSAQEIDATLRAADVRLAKFPAVQSALLAKNLSQLHMLGPALEAVRWDRWK
jgi:hypothetical protein